MNYHCCDQKRLQAVKKNGTLNGIDYLEVIDHDAPAGSPSQRTLLVRLLLPVPAGFSGQQVRIEGGERERDIEVEWADAASVPPADASPAEEALFAALTEPDHVLVVRTDRYGDFSTYTLRLVRSALDARPLVGFDPVLSEVDFNFKVECPNEFDCKPVTVCSEEWSESPPIDYLAKDYPTFRRQILDRIMQLVPGWRERSAADFGVTLAELIAYVGDQLSYQQDAIATEAYLETARLRTSLRRHALLVDYRVHDGCNARVWLHVLVDANTVVLPRKGVRFYGRMPGLNARIVPGSSEDAEALRGRPVVFEPLYPPLPAEIELHAALNEIAFYTWGDERCCLPKGATRATLSGHFPALEEGDVLLFEEVKGPITGKSGDADPSHRHVVRLTSVTADTDPLTATDITEIAWAAEDAVPFALCISAITDKAHGEQPVSDVSLARGNMLLADHGYTLPQDEPLGEVPPERLSYPPANDAGACSSNEPLVIPARFRPQLAQAPLTFAAVVKPKSAGDVGAPRPFDPDAPAVAALQWSMEDTLPELALASELDGMPQDWQPVRDLLNSEPDDAHFVVEVEHDCTAYLRFGDGVYGKRPAPGTVFSAGPYRIGNGRAGNVGADTIAHIVSGDDGVLGVRNPLPAAGGVDMEDDATVRRHAPQAFRRQERAVTPEDYVEVTQRHSGIQRAAATLRWTGSWHTVFITVDRDGGLPMDAAFEDEVTRHVDRYRMAGHDTEFNDPVYVSLEIDLMVCVKPDYLRADVRGGLLDVLSNRTLPTGKRGLFHPDNLSFGQTVYLSPLYAAAREVAGVDSIEVTKFQRQGTDDPAFLGQGFMRLSRLEIPRLDNDPSFPEHGVLRLSMYGGK